MNIETLEVAGFAPALHAMRNPMNSWDKNDSGYVETEMEDGSLVNTFVTGTADTALSARLQNSGPEHCKHLRMIMVWADIDAPLYWWKQMDCYRNGVEKISTSTMHTLLKKPFEMSSFCFDALPGFKNEPRQFVPDVDETEEKWVDYFGYKVSSEGRILNNEGREIKGVLHKDGYRFAWFRGRIVPFHRIIAKCFCDGYKDGLVVDHIDGNKQNNKASNLEWVTQKENIKRSRENHLQPNQTKFFSGKLSAEQRETVIKLYSSGKYSQRELSRMFDVSHSMICSIVNGRYSYSGGVPNIYERIAKPLVNELNRLRDDYMDEQDAEEKKAIWESIVRLLPESFIQKRTVMFSYAALRNIYRQRKGHKLKEWQTFREWCESLPESWMITE